MAEYREYIVRETAFPLGGTRQEVVGELVRCGECWKRGDEDFCPMVHDNCYPPTLPDDLFCADGERREEPTMEEYMYGQEGSEEDGSL